jgi:hypothetical protein
LAGNLSARERVARTGLPDPRLGGATLVVTGIPREVAPISTWCALEESGNYFCRAIILSLIWL